MSPPPPLQSAAIPETSGASSPPPPAPAAPLVMPLEVPKAHVMRQDAFRAALATQERAAAEAQAATDEAARILAKAEAQAAEILANAQTRAEDRDRRLSEMSEESLTRFLREDAVTMSATAITGLLAQSRAIQADVNNAQSWVLPLLRAGLMRMLATLPPEDVMAGLVAQGLAELRQRWDLVLRCHPSVQDTLRCVVAEDPRLAAAIREVQGDRTQAPEGLCLISGEGVLDLSVTTQTEAFLRAVEDLLAAPDEEAENG